MLHNTDFARAEAALPVPAFVDVPGQPGAADHPQVSVLRGTLLALVRRDGRDLTVRQLTAFLSIYMDKTTHSLSSIADLLEISRPGVTRIIDRLAECDLVARQEDREDRRRVLVRRTSAGAAFFREVVEFGHAMMPPSEQRRPAASDTRAAA